MEFLEIFNKSAIKLSPRALLHRFFEMERIRAGKRVPESARAGGTQRTNPLPDRVRGPPGHSHTQRLGMLRE